MKKSTISHLHFLRITTHVAICVEPLELERQCSLFVKNVNDVTPTSLSTSPECIHPQNQHPISRASILRPYVATMSKNIRRLGDMSNVANVKMLPLPTLNNQSFIHPYRLTNSRQAAIPYRQHFRRAPATRLWFNSFTYIPFITLKAIILWGQQLVTTLKS